jgi:acetylornithine deacetylase/succinyl-diaminopimelate desuccinylase-like protein
MPLSAHTENHYRGQETEMTDEAVELLTEYLRIDTSNPPGNEAAATRFFSDILEREGVEYRTYQSEKNRVSIRAVIRGDGRKKPIILLNHMDVVPAEAAQWSVDPFGGVIKDGYLYGRGALDMKGQGIMELMAFLALKREGLSLTRDLIFLSVADEEAGGVHGVQYLLDHHAQDFEADFVINEGGYGLTGLLPDRPVFMVSTAEKGFCWLKITTTGQPGHGSVPHGKNALEGMNAALYRLMTAEDPGSIPPIVLEYFRNLGVNGWDFLQPYLDDGRPETLVDQLNQSGFIHMPQIAAMVKNTISLTQIHAGNKVNVIPGRAEATVDIRLLPGQSIESCIDAVRQHMGDSNFTVDVIGSHPATASPKDTEYFGLIEKTLAESYREAVVTPSLLFATSDSRFFRERGVTTYGFCPVLVGLEDIQTIHGADEKISIENIRNGTSLYSELIHKLCC